LDEPHRRTIRVRLETALGAGGRSALLDRVRQLMGDQEISRECSRPVFAGPESDIGTYREGACGKRARELGSTGIGVQAYVTKAPSKAPFHPGADAEVEGLAGSQLRSHRHPIRRRRQRAAPRLRFALDGLVSARARGLNGRPKRADTLGHL
jgi:hypothetical protein